MNIRNYFPKEDGEGKVSVLMSFIAGLLLAQCATRFCIRAFSDESLASNFYGLCICICVSLLMEILPDESDEMIFRENNFLSFIFGGIAGEFILLI